MSRRHETRIGGEQCDRSEICVAGLGVPQDLAHLLLVFGPWVLQELGE